MKKLIMIVLAASLCLTLTSCGGGDDAPTSDTTTQPPSSNDSEEEDSQDSEATPSPVYPEFDAPQWDAAGIENKYDNNMTVYVVLPDSLASTAHSDDEIAVFCGDECRGVAYSESLGNGKSVWMAMVYGNDGDALTFKYYSASSRHLYNTGSTISFSGDTQYGNVDAPVALSLVIVSEK